HGLFRAHQKQIISFRPHRRHATAQSRKEGQTGLPSSRWLKRLGKHDQLVEYSKPKERPAWLTEEEYAALPETLVVREVRYTIKDRTRRTRVVTLVTTLLDPEEYPAKDLAKLYGLRWGVETNLKHLKQTLHLDVLRCKTVEGVLKELALVVLIYNLVRRGVWGGARRQGGGGGGGGFMGARRWRGGARARGARAPLVGEPERAGRGGARRRKR